ncbi:antibiotic biosynthesis monooxygenase [Klebsiella pneumoniae]|nr:antibiotic biosynthesis monooxygenase [Klebsiella pneumoniae]MDV5299768.1 antibiotic biosynthesis monooxygenase [Klebsiella pneumoniae]
MKKTLMLLICILDKQPCLCNKTGRADKRVMNIFELGVRPDRDKDFADVARQTISASVDHEAGTLAMYALHRSDNPRKAFMVELYENERLLQTSECRTILPAARAPDIIDRKNKITLSHSFWGTNISYRMSEPLIIW